LESQDENSKNPYIAEARKIYADEDEASGFASACLNAEKAALNLIAGAEQYSHGLRLKLKKKNYETACVNAVIARLTELKAVDDSRYAKLWLGSKIRSKRTSPMRLLKALRAKGIEHGEAEAALKECMDEEAEIMLLGSFIKSYSKKIKSKIDKGAASLRYLLKTEGFSPQAISHFVTGEKNSLSP
jgi:regulatory protein